MAGDGNDFELTAREGRHTAHQQIADDDTVVRPRAVRTIRRHSQPE
jgi:hypothetical protein